MSGGYTDLDLNAPAPAGTVRKHVKLIEYVIVNADLAVLILVFLYVIAFLLWLHFQERPTARVSPEAGQPRNPANQGQHHALAQVTHIAQPAPLPRPREGITWPAHEV